MHLSLLTLITMYLSKAREGVFDKVEWDKWFYEPGMPPFTPT